MCNTCPAPVIAIRNESSFIKSPRAISAAPACFRGPARLRTPHEGTDGAAFLGDRCHHPLAGLAGCACHQDRFIQIHFNSKTSGARSCCALWSLLRCNGLACCRGETVARYRPPVSWGRDVNPSSFWRAFDMVLRKLFAVSAILACTAFGAHAQGQAQPWPSRTVKIVVPYAAGGNSDVMARVVAQRLTEHFGQTFIVENRVGANGALAADTVARSPRRRLHVALGCHTADDDRAGDGQAQSRSDQGFCADQRGRDQRFRARGAQGFPAEDRWRSSSPM